MNLGIDNKKALVIGASRGLGKAIAIALAEEGCSVIAAARSVDKIEEWTRSLPAGPASKISPAKLDLSDRQSVDLLVDNLIANGGVDILINNCGGPAPETALNAGSEAWAQSFDSMAISIFHLSARVAQSMMARSFGRIITIGSSGIEQPISGLAISNGVRGAVAGWSKTLAAELAPHGITVNLVIPGRIDTERVQSLDASRADREARSIDDVRKSSAIEIPARRYGRPEEFAAVTVFLASERASYVTGSMVRVDGGLVRSI